MGFLSTIGGGLLGIGGGDTTDHPSGSTDPWFQNFYPKPGGGIQAPGSIYEQGGITGAPSADPSQLQPNGSITFNPNNPDAPGGANWTGGILGGLPQDGQDGSGLQPAPTPPMGAFGGGVKVDPATGQVVSSGSLGGMGGGAGMVPMRLPSGRRISVPMQHIAEALRRGARRG